MKILLVGAGSGYNLEWCIKDALERMGHSVVYFDYIKASGIAGKYNVGHILADFSPKIRSFLRIIGIDRANEELKKHVLKISPNVVLTVKGEYVLPETIEWIKKEFSTPTILWFTDDPLFFNSVSKYIAPAFDYVFTSSEYCVPKYRELGVEHVEYLPFACNPSIHRHVNLTEKEIAMYENDVCFVGTCYPWRIEVLRRLTKFRLDVWGKFWKWFLINPKLKRAYRGRPVYGEELIKVYHATKIALNMHTPPHWYAGQKANLRVFEATGCGTFLITDNPGRLGDLYRIGRELVCYKDKDELVELVEYYVDNTEERTAIAKRGQERAYKEHTYVHRLTKILSAIKK